MGRGKEKGRRHARRDATHTRPVALPPFPRPPPALALSHHSIHLRLFLSLSLSQWKPTREGYLRFLAESLAVYEALEDAVAANDAYAPFRATGLERSAALRADIAWFKATYGLDPPALAADGPGNTYAALVKRLAREDPPAFICHFYNTYFAHTAGGRMIGAKLSASLLDGATLAFYTYDGDFRPLLDAVRAKIDAAAAGWSREDKDRCLDETAASFKYSGALLRTIAEPTKK